MFGKKTSIFRGLIEKSFDVCEAVFDVLCFNKTGLLESSRTGFHYAGNVVVNADFHILGLFEEK